MSAVTKLSGWISPEEYIQGELRSEVRHEYLDGFVYAMAGASDDHNRIAGNIFGELRERLRGKRCEAFINDMKVKIPPTFENVYYYPDGLVACDPSDNAKYFRERPAVIFEVISPDTERIDRREKVLAYRHVPGIQAYVIVEQSRIALTMLQPAEPGWNSTVLEGPNNTLKLASINIEIPFDRIYERTSLMSVAI